MRKREGKRGRRGGGGGGGVHYGESRDDKNETGSVCASVNSWLYSHLSRVTVANTLVIGPSTSCYQNRVEGRVVKK